ncbi:MAG: TRAP transporter substrate-binding protein DctP [Desulfobulbaceae bacterium]|nr:TRAP transporter substrate-binding protein DctP [Desulfobulbaceae bacterium]
MKRYTAAILFTIIALLISTLNLHAAPKYMFKIASLAPGGSVWIDQFNKFAKEITEKTGGEVGFRIYPGGVMGDDQAMFRKMRVGQLHGGGFTMTGISRVVPDFRVMAIPFLFESYQEIDYVKEGLIPDFKKQFRDKGLEFISMTEVGFIYAMSTKAIKTYDAFRSSKNWIPTGDPISEIYLDALDISPVQLTIPDVLPSLQSGLVDTVYNSLYGSIVLQWFTKARYIIDFPYGYAYGVFALNAKKYHKLPKSHQDVIQAAAKTHFPILLKKTRESNVESHQVLQDRGIEFIKLEEETITILREKRDEAIQRLVPDAISQDIQDKTFKLLDEYRKQ